MLKALLITLLAAIPGSGGTGPLQSTSAADWKSLGESQAAVYAYDAAHVRRMAGGRSDVRYRWTYRTDTEEGRRASARMAEITTPAMEGKVVPPVAYGIMTITIDCAARKYRLGEQAVFAANDELIERVPNSLAEWQPVPRESIYESLLVDACDGGRRVASAASGDRNDDPKSLVTDISFRLR